MCENASITMLLAARDHDPFIPLLLILLGVLLLICIAAAFNRRQQDPPEFVPFEEPQPLAPPTDVSSRNGAPGPGAMVEIDTVEVIVVQPPGHNGSPTERAVEWS